MVAGHLSVKNGNYYAVLNYKNAEGKRKTKWISLGLPEKGNKRKAEAELVKLRSEFEVPEEVGDLAAMSLSRRFSISVPHSTYLCPKKLTVKIFMLSLLTGNTIYIVTSNMYIVKR